MIRRENSVPRKNALVNGENQNDCGCEMIVVGAYVNCYFVSEEKARNFDEQWAVCEKENGTTLPKELRTTTCECTWPHEAVLQN